MNKIVLGLAIGALAVTPSFAEHNNPWSGAEDIIQGKNHDANQEKSVGTPGKDEMNGQMAQTANTNAGGGLGGSAPSDGSGHQGGAGGGNGGAGGGNGGAGGGNGGAGGGNGGAGRS